MNCGVAAVERAGVLHADRHFRLVQDEPVYQFHALHKGVIGIGDLVLPHSEPTAGIDAVALKERDRLGENCVALDTGRRIAVVGVIGPGIDDVLAICFADQAGVDQPVIVSSTIVLPSTCLKSL